MPAGRRKNKHRGSRGASTLLSAFISFVIILYFNRIDKSKMRLEFAREIPTSWKIQCFYIRLHDVGQFLSSSSVHCEQAQQRHQSMQSLESWS